MRTHLFLAVSLLALAPAAVRADGDDDGQLKLTEADVAAFKKVSYADALADARASTRAGAHQETEADRADYVKALASAKWTKERFEEVRQEISNVLMLLADAASGDNQADAKEQLASKDKGTVAVLKAHADELRAEGWRKQAQGLAKGEADDRRTGRAPTAAELVGTWTFDLEATLKGFEGMLGKDGAEKMRPTMPKKSVMVLGAGGALEQTQEQPGRPAETMKGKWRVEGKKLWMKAEKREHESSLDVGMKDGALVVSMFGAGMVYKRK